MTSVRLIHGVCPAALADLADASVDSVVTDAPYELGFMGKRWDSSGIAYSVDLWREVLRVLKPGGHLVAFGGTRTYHRMACAIEDAGFEIRDSLEWLYGNGFPKSLSVSKAIDACRAKEPGVIVESWSGWGTALKPSHEPIVLARKPLIGTVAANVLEHGTGGLNVDGCRVGYGGKTLDEVHREAGGPGKHGKTRGVVYGDGLDQRDSAIEFNAAGRWPPNLLLTHSPDCGETCTYDCPVRMLDEQSGDRTSGGRTGQHGPNGGIFHRDSQVGKAIGPFPPDSGSASRFFPVFRYVPKPPRAERDAGLWDLEPSTAGEATDRQDGTAGLQNPRAGAGRTGGARNIHPTVKPIALMEWLVRLITPPGGTVLDPFLGSGTTGCAAVRLGFAFVGVEQKAQYIEIARRRIGLAANAPRSKPIAQLERGEEALPGQASLFGETA